MNLLVSRIIKVLLLSPIALLTACAGSGDGTTVTSIIPDKPLIDEQAPTVVETATFALG